ncbi:MAG: phosphate ABC transporter substrate-binding protein PstS, partial [Candidatus Sulfotelmatobacter sp.]
MRRIVLLWVCAFLALPAVSQTTLNGAGATFPNPIYSKWFSEYKKLHPEVQVNYQSIGSGGGIRQVTEGTVDFGASDMPMTDAQLTEAQAKRKTKILNIPSVLGAVVPAYNIPGVSGEVKFTPDALAEIFLGKITKWNDKAITSVNPGVNFPDKDIIVVHRSDGSGTTFIWTDYLSKVSADWKSEVGSNTSVKWPIGL